MKQITIFAFVYLILFTGCSGAGVQIATLKEFSGTVEFSRGGAQSFEAAQKEQPLFTGDEIRVRADSSATILFATGSAIHLKDNAFFEVRDDSCLGRQNSGTAYYDVNKHESEIVIETPHGTTAILGTQFCQLITEDTFDLWVKEGKVKFTRNGQSRLVEANYRLHHSSDKPLAEAETMTLPEQIKIFKTGKSGFEFNRR